jgi:hypothetical protein
MMSEDSDARVQVDRIRLRMNGIERIDPEALARAIATRLAPTLLLAPGQGAIDSLRVEVHAQDGDDHDALAERTVIRLAPLINRVGGVQ